MGRASHAAGLPCRYDQDDPDPPDGEVCLEQQLRKLFPQAILTLDIRHAQERLWKVGRLLHAEGSPELAAWVEPLAELLYQGQGEPLLEQLRSLCFQGPGSKQKRQIQCKAIADLQRRVALLQYGAWRAQDWVLASGVVEGAARSVIGERLDNSGRRWLVERAEAVLLLRCLEVNGDWDAFFAWSDKQRRDELMRVRWCKSAAKSRRSCPRCPKRPNKHAAAERQRRRRDSAVRSRGICTHHRPVAQMDMLRRLRRHQDPRRRLLEMHWGDAVGGAESRQGGRNSWKGPAGRHLFQTPTGQSRWTLPVVFWERWLSRCS